MAAPQKVSFTVRRPTPVSRAASSGPESDSSSFKVPTLPRHLAPSAETTPIGSPLARSETNSPYTRDYDDSSDESDGAQDELVTGFDQFGVQRVHEDKRKKQEPLVIPPLKNKDWRELARKRRGAQQFVPTSAKVETGVDGSVGGLGTRDVIGAGSVLSGLQFHKNVVKAEEQDGLTVVETVTEDIKMEKDIQLSEEELARRALLAEANGVVSEGPTIDTIPMPISEGEAYKQDVEELPETASLEDYARVPVEQFGAAMLRGMGWKEGTAASKGGKGPVQPYLPVARPALLGIGAKEREIFDDGSKKKGPYRPERRYVPVMKKERGDTPGSGRDRSRSPRHGSRRNSRSPTRGKGHRDRYSDYDRNRDHEREKERDRARDRDEERGKDMDKYRERGGDRDRRERNGDRRYKDKQRDHDRERPDSRGDRSRDSDKKNRD